ncbi:AAA family ATPase [Conexibacter woesei]|uniref:SMC domain protein n=1 Tax=Conexibacter woesei (strain DSM 14684 / CCUG 47730 / CIP 108061 / JCM 11494 / NBRC 100937 / ID131577) TaxID=469383 RepID=D3FE19_CONWI|nr:AAA family ATPase [Conexibacter woesei]ADB51635.1 SMC domain protein [Conexibacter woesei DSM 14684]
MNTAFLHSVSLRPPGDGEPERSGHPWTLPVVEALAAETLALDPAVTFLVGENGSGKSTLIEALAGAAGMNVEGGSSNFAFSTREQEGGLGDALRLARGIRRPRTDFFLRAESLFNAATYLEGMRAEPFGSGALDAYGGRSLHDQSHGESFLAVVLNRFGPDGLYLLDEPEAALSAQNCLTLLRRMHELVSDGAQFVVATHSPVLLAYPGATIYELSADGIEQVAYDDAAPVQLTRAFLAAPDAFVRRLLDAS